VSIEEGRAEKGGGIFNFLGIVTLTNTYFYSNKAVVFDKRAFGAGGGGIYNMGDMTLTNTTLFDNSAESDRNRSESERSGGAIFNAGTMRLTNTTLDDNRATNGFGGGIYNFNNGTMTLSNTTLSGNRAFRDGGGIDNAGAMTLIYSTLAGNSRVDNASTGTMTLLGTIVADGCTGSIADSGYNLSSDSSCNLTQPTDITNTNPLLDQLDYYGGPTQTRALQAGSPAIDKGGTAANGCPATDQRGITRPQGPACDIGAYEWQAVQMMPSLTITPTQGAPGSRATVGGSGYGTYQRVVVQWDCVSSGCRSPAQLLTIATADAAGAFSVQVTIPPTAPVGPHTIGGTAPGGIFATTSYTVTS
jgi:parallel beta-helix repeat protein